MGFELPKQEKTPAPEKISNWRENKEKAPERARAHLVEHELALDVTTAPLADLEKLVKELPELIKELSYKASNAVMNENRYVVLELTAHLEDAKASLNYFNAPKSRIRA